MTSGNDNSDALLGMLFTKIEKDIGRTACNTTDAMTQGELIRFVLEVRKLKEKFARDPED